MRTFLPLLLLALFLAGAAAASDTPAPSLDADSKELLRRPEFEKIEISPDGNLLAIAQRTAAGTIVSINRRDNLEPVTSIDPGKNGEIDTLRWLDNQRLLVGANRADGLYGMSMIEPALYIVNADGKDTFRLPANFVATIDGDPDHLLVSSCTHWQDGDCVLEIRRAEIGKLRRIGELVIAAPDSHSTLRTDRRGHARFAIGFDDAGFSKAYVHDEGKAGWTLINDESKTQLAVIPISVAADNLGGYLLSERETGPDVVERYDFATGKRTLVFAHPYSSPLHYVYSIDGKEPIGAVYGATRPELRFWNPQHPDAILLTELQGSFKGRLTYVVSSTADGQHLVVYSGGDRDPGSFYLFDRKLRKASLLARARPWLKPEQLGAQQPVELDARDGLPLRGLLTLPANGSGKQLPMVVMVHGGPYGIVDQWGFDQDTQLLSRRGYAVLQVNFRGSGSFGREFEQRGLRQWGRAMQDDVSDATRWAISHGIADPQRICIYGVSYGGYAALMGPVREPGLYRCAVGRSGVYNLAKLYRWGNVHRSNLGEDYLKRAIGEDAADLASRSPVELARQIGVPVLLAHGTVDARADIRHARALASALKKQKQAVELVEYPYMGHFLVRDEQEEDFHARLLLFLDRHLQAPAAAAATAH